MQSLVSVVIPCYNQEKYLAEAIQSVIDQDYRPLQIIISDDASTDATPQIAQRYKEQYPDLIDLQLHKVNLGVSRNCDSLHPLVKGEYICWFAGDDLLLPGKISAQVNAFEQNPGAVLCYHNIAVFSEKDNVSCNYYNRLTGHIPFSGSIVPKFLQYRGFIAGPSLMIRKSVAGNIKHRQEIGICSDWLYIIELAHRGSAIYLDAVLGKYRRHDKNLSNLSLASAEEEVFHFVETHYPEYSKDVNRGRMHLFTVEIFKNLFAGQGKKSWFYFKKCCRLLKTDMRLFFVMISVLLRHVRIKGIHKIKTGFQFLYQN